MEDCLQGISSGPHPRYRTWLSIGRPTNLPPGDKNKTLASLPATSRMPEILAHIEEPLVRRTSLLHKKRHQWLALLLLGSRLPTSIRLGITPGSLFRNDKKFKLDTFHYHWADHNLLHSLKSCFQWAFGGRSCLVRGAVGATGKMDLNFIFECMNAILDTKYFSTMLASLESDLKSVAMTLP